MVRQRVFSVNDFRVMTEAGLFTDQKVELIDGVIVDMSPANPEHEDSIDELTEQMVNVFSKRARVRVEKAIDINDDYWLPHPDLVLAKRRCYGDNPPKPEDIFLIIEVSNTTLVEDLGKKLERYAILRVQDYWVANLKTKTWLIHRQPFEDAYLSVTEFSFGSSFAPLVFSEDTNIWL
jgi:Uma2 family endonuclease